MIVTMSVTCQTFQTIWIFGLLLVDRILLVKLSEEQKHLDLTLFKPQPEEYAEIEANLISTLPQQQTLNQLQTQQSILLID